MVLTYKQVTCVDELNKYLSVTTVILIDHEFYSWRRETFPLQGPSPLALNVVVFIVRLKFTMNTWPELAIDCLSLQELVVRKVNCNDTCASFL